MYDALTDAFLAYCDQADARKNDDVAFSPHVFRVELELALNAALGQERQGREAHRIATETRKAALSSKAAKVKDAPRCPATVSILTEDWFSDAAKATGEEQDVMPDEADPELRAAAAFLQRNPLPSEWSEDYLDYLRRFERTFGFEVEEAQLVPLRTQDEIGRDRDDLQFLGRFEEKPDAKFHMTKAEERRKWIMDARLRYLGMVQEAVEKNRVSRDKAKAYPAIQSFVNLNRAIMARHAFIEELARHGVFNPKQDTVVLLKAALGGTYAEANAKLAARRQLAEAGKLDRYKHELVG